MQPAARSGSGDKSEDVSGCAAIPSLRHKLPSKKHLSCSAANRMLIQVQGESDFNRSLVVAYRSEIRGDAVCDSRLFQGCSPHRVWIIPQALHIRVSPRSIIFRNCSTETRCTSAAKHRGQMWGCFFVSCVHPQEIQEKHFNLPIRLPRCSSSDGMCENLVFC